MHNGMCVFVFETNQTRRFQTFNESLKRLPLKASLSTKSSDNETQLLSSLCCGIRLNRGISETVPVFFR
jgi:hypothetical protein